MRDDEGSINIHFLLTVHNIQKIIKMISHPRSWIHKQTRRLGLFWNKIQLVRPLSTVGWSPATRTVYKRQQHALPLRTVRKHNINTSKQRNLPVVSIRRTIGSLRSILWKSCINSFRFNLCFVPLKLGQRLLGGNGDGVTSAARDGITRWGVFDE